MNPIKLPELAPMVSDEILAVPKNIFNTLVAYVNSLTDVVNTQSVLIKELSTELTTCRRDIANIAKILEDIYDET